MPKTQTEDGKKWEGWGTALKPSHEPICMARKPLIGTVVENVIKYGTGGINIDGCRVDGKTEIHSNGKRSMYGGNSLLESKTHNDKTEVKDYGRFPANLIHDNSEEVRECFPETKSSKGSFKAGDYEERETSTNFTRGDFEGRGDSGNASRFFKSIVYIPKASKSERNKGCEKIEPQQRDESRKEGNVGGDNPRNRGVHKIQNNHPTVKPVALMRYLIKLITPPKGIVLDPFMGSGSTGIAAKLEGFDFIGIEKEPEYVKIAEARIKAWEKEPQQDKLL